MPGGISKSFETESGASGSVPVSVKESDDAYINRPNIDGCKFFVNGEIREWTGDVKLVESPIFLEGTEQKVLHMLLKSWCFDHSPACNDFANSNDITSKPVTAHLSTDSNWAASSDDCQGILGST
jgi:hypothetical protein